MVEGLGTRNRLHAAMVKAGDAWFVISPLQSTKEKMHTFRTLDVDRHKQLVMYAYIDRICKKNF